MKIVPILSDVSLESDVRTSISIGLQNPELSPESPDGQ